MGGEVYHFDGIGVSVGEGVSGVLLPGRGYGCGNDSAGISVSFWAGLDCLSDFWLRRRPLVLRSGALLRGWVGDHSAGRVEMRARKMGLRNFGIKSKFLGHREIILNTRLLRTMCPDLQW